MNSVGFLCILRDAGDAAALLCADIAAVARPGDQVVLVDDTGPGVNFHTSAVTRHFGAMQGWPKGVEVRVISTGIRGAGDEGVAVNLALRGARADHLIVLPGTARLGPGFATARDMAETQDLVTAAVMAPERIAPEKASAHLSRLIFARSLAEGLACREGHDAGGVLPLLAGLLARAKTPATCDDVLAHLPGLPRITPDWLALWAAHLPDPALIAEGLRRAAPGTRAIVAGVLGAEGPMPAPEPLSAPEALSGAPLRILTPGPHARRSPLAYAALRPLWEGVAELTTEPDAADLICFAHPWDVRDMETEVARRLEAAPETPVALLSEEPFWDSLFSPDPLADHITLPAAHLGQLRLAQLNHHTSEIYAFDRIPYFLLTDPGYAARYAAMFARNAALSVQDWQARFADYERQVVFMAERREEGFHDIRNAAGGLTGLCAWRTRLALACDGPGVARIGASWEPGVPRRQALADWHADKLARLDGTARVISGVENTHQPLYLSEKLFDAFACGARPLYWAEQTHALHRLDLPVGSWLNLAGLTPELAAEAVTGAAWDAGFFDAYREAQQQLSALWLDAGGLGAEQARLSRALQDEILRLAAD